MKRLTDVILITLFLPLLIPIFILVAILVGYKLGFPVFFKQTRPGLKGELFEMIKFRSMTSDVDENCRHLPDEVRLTLFGKFLRSTSLDELPGLLNVLKGDMSIVGPRPEQSIFAKRFAETIPYYGFRHTVRPGITGWAQVKLGYTADENQTRLKLEYDFFYIKYLSLWLEIIILVRTIGTVILGKGAR